MKILITGGAGFIGQSLARHLLTLGHEISLLDSFLPQVHAGKTTLPPDLANDVRLVSGDVADPAVLQSGLEGQQGVVHFAAETGTGQSMYEVVRYQRTNVGGSALLYELLGKRKKGTLERMVVASSRSIYGEGAYRCERDGLVYPQPRSVQREADRTFRSGLPSLWGRVPNGADSGIGAFPAFFVLWVDQASARADGADVRSRARYPHGRVAISECLWTGTVSAESLHGYPCYLFKSGSHRADHSSL